jgi:AbrB family looped-hinge helix DNA binding protein
MPKITTGGRVTIPKRIRMILRLRAGDRVEFLEVEKGEFAMVRAKKRLRPQRLPNWKLRSAT